MAPSAGATGVPRAFRRPRMGGDVGDPIFTVLIDEGTETGIDSPAGRWWRPRDLLSFAV